MTMEEKAEAASIEILSLIKEQLAAQLPFIQFHDLKNNDIDRVKSIILSHTTTSNALQDELIALVKEYRQSTSRDLENAVALCKDDTINGPERQCYGTAAKAFKERIELIDAVLGKVEKE